MPISANLILSRRAADDDINTRASGARCAIFGAAFFFHGHFVFVTDKYRHQSMMVDTEISIAVRLFLPKSLVQARRLFYREFDVSLRLSTCSPRRPMAHEAESRRALFYADRNANV